MVEDLRRLIELVGDVARLRAQRRLAPRRRQLGHPLVQVARVGERLLHRKRLVVAPVAVARREHRRAERQHGARRLLQEAVGGACAKVLAPRELHVER